MLTQTMQDKLNEQLGLEFASANIYLQMGAWCAHQSLDGCARFLIAQADEEMQHMRRLYDYIGEAGALAIIPALDAPPHVFDSVREIFATALDHEKLVTRRINELTAVAFEEGDFSTFNFLQWYVAEQHEEEALFSSLLDKIDMVGTDGRGLFFLDQEIGALAGKGAEAVTASQGGA